MRFAIAFLSIAFLSASGFTGPVFAQNEKPPTGSQQPPATQPQTPASQAQQRQKEQLKQRLVSAMNQLIPGETKQGSPRAKQLDQVAELFATGKMKECKDAVDAIVQADKTFPPTNLIFASLFFAVNNGNAGRQFLEKAATETPEYPATYAGFARIAVNQNRVTDADALVAMMKTKFDAGTWSKDQNKQFRIEFLDIKTDIAMRRDQLDQANAYLVELAKLLPDDSRVPLRQARVSFQKNDVDQTIKYLEKARTGNENEILVAPLMLANWYRQRGDFENLTKWIETASQKHKDDKNVQLEYARWLIEQQKLNKANIWVSNAEKNGANEVTTTFMKGQIAFLKQNYDVAEMHFAKIHTAQPSNVDAANLLALALIESQNEGKRRRALELARISVGIAPKNSASVSVLGWVYHKLGNTQSAAQHLNPVAQQRRLSPESAYFVAQFLADQGNDKNAMMYLNAISNNPGIFLYRRQADSLKQKLKTKLESSPDGNSKKQDKNK